MSIFFVGESLSSKNSSALNEVYCNGFKDGIVHILNELRKMNLLTPTQTERLLKEQSKQNEAKAFQKEFSFSENEDDTNNIAREATEVEEDISSCVKDMNIPVRIQFAVNRKLEAIAKLYLIY